MGILRGGTKTWHIFWIQITATDFGEVRKFLVKSNDFKEQEKGSDEEIAQFCQVNFGVTFPLMKKSSVVKSETQNEVFKWLTDSTKNGWNGKQPSWNFSKYLVNEEGILTHYFDPSVSPTSEQVLKEIEQ